MAYLPGWGMLLVKILLRQKAGNVAQAIERVCYGSANALRPSADTSAWRRAV